MNCPRCGSGMEQKEKPAMARAADGTGFIRGTQKVWFCRDCKVCVPIK